MAYTKTQLAELSLIAIKKNKLVFIDEIIVYLPCNRKTFYNKNLNIYEPILEALNFNKIEVKRKLRGKWLRQKNATSEIMLYRLLSDENEFNKMTQSKQDITSGGEKVDQIFKIGENIINFGSE